MKIYFTTKDGYLNGVSSTSMRRNDEFCAEVQEDHEVLRNPEVFKYEKGKLIKDEQKQQELIAQSQKDESRQTDDEINALAIMELSEKIMNLERG